MALAIVSKNARPQEMAALEAAGFSVLPCPPSPFLPEPIADHPDAILSILGRRIYCYEEYYKENVEFFSALKALCPSATVIPLPDAPKHEYPGDCAYNLLSVSRHVFFNTKGLAPSLAAACEKCGYQIHHVRQGYAACTVRTLGNRHAITADAGMARALEEAGINVLLIREGGISLPPYASGFIGGASGFFKDTAYFFGSLPSHPCGKEIGAFIRAASFSAKSLSDEPLRDFGGILFIE